MSDKFSKNLENVLDEVKFILSEDRERTEGDALFVEQIKLIFVQKEGNEEKIIFPKTKKEFTEIIINFIDIIYILFKNPSKKRAELYTLYVDDITEKTLLKKINNIKSLKDVEINLPNKKLKGLYNAINDLLQKKLLYNFLDFTLIEISFIINNDSSIKFIIYSQAFTLAFNQGFQLDQNYLNNEINLNDDLCIELITSLFQKNGNDEDVLVSSLLINLYGKIKYLTKDYDLKKIKDSMRFAIKKFRKSKCNNDDMFFENIIILFNDELKNENKINNDNIQPIQTDNIKDKISFNANEKRDNIKTYIYNLLEKIKNMNNINKKELHTIVDEIKDKFEILFEKMDAYERELKKEREERKEEIEKERQERKEEIEKEKGKLEKERQERMEEIEKERQERNNIENILNEHKIKVHNLEEKQKKNKVLNEKRDKKEEQAKKEIENLKKRIKDLEGVEQTNKKRIKTLERDLKKMEKLKEEKNDKDKEIKELKNYSKDLEKTIGDIQFRIFAKNFLKYFKRYLNEEELQKIRDKPYKKGEIILDKFINLFSNCRDKKIFNLTKNLIFRASKLLNFGNDNAHNISLLNYKCQIMQYKEKNALLYIYSPLTFIFCINLDLNENDFKDAFILLDEYFDENLMIKKDKIDEFHSNFI